MRGAPRDGAPSGRADGVSSLVRDGDRAAAEGVVGSRGGGDGERDVRAAIPLGARVLRALPCSLSGRRHTRDASGVVSFQVGRVPSREEIASVAERVEKGMTRWLRKRKLIDERPIEERSGGVIASAGALPRITGPPVPARYARTERVPSAPCVWPRIACAGYPPAPPRVPPVGCSTQRAGRGSSRGSVIAVR